MPTLKIYKKDKEREYLDLLIANTGGELATMLETSGLSRSHLYALLKKHDIAL